MSNPQRPELARSRKTPSQDPDATAAVLDGQRHPGAGPDGGNVPPDNQPGHHPPEEQDKPDPQAFAEKFGIVEPSDRTEEPATAAPPLVARAVEPVARRVPAYAGGLVGAALVVLGLFFVRARRRRRP